MNPPSSPFTVPFDGSFRVAGHRTEPPEGSGGRKALERPLAERVEEISDLQRKLYADDRFALLLAFQKPFMRLAVARIVADTLKAMPLRWPEKDADELALFEAHVAALEGEDS